MGAFSRLESEESTLEHEDSHHFDCSGTLSQPSGRLSTSSASKKKVGRARKRGIWSSSSSSVLRLQHQLLQLLQHRLTSEGSSISWRSWWVCSGSSVGEIKQNKTYVL